MSSGAIAIATSIPPILSRRNAGRAIDSEYQRLCISSWRDCGFRLISVNHPDEIPGLAAAYPDVSFIAVDRDASAISGRKTPYIADLLSALIQAPEPVVGIINSDLVFEPSPAWQVWLPRIAARALVTGQRHDATSLLDGTFRKYYWGFDFFFFSRDAASELLETAMPFAMGLSWWDYWLPAAFALKGRQVLTLDRPTAAHLIHKEPYLDDSWRQLAVRFASFVAREIANSLDAPPAGMGTMLRLCREIAQMTETQWRGGATDAQISQVAVQFVPTITSNVINAPADAGSADPPPSSGITAGEIFRGFAQRVAAGEALERAKRLEREGRTAAAKSDFLYALERTPRDFDVLSAFGEFHLRNGNFGGAVELLRRAIESEPDDRPVYCSLAIALHESRNHQEAIACLEEATRKWPDFIEARELSVRLSRRFRWT